MSCKVINIIDAPEGWKDNPEYVYIGRYNRRLGLSRSICQNPFRIGQHGTREEVVAKFESYICSVVKANPLMMNQIKRLKGKTLVCWCKPLACHGDILAQLCEELNASPVQPNPIERGEKA